MSLQSMEKSIGITSTEKAGLVADSADDRRALNLVTLDLQGLTIIADYFVICSGTSDVHIRAIASGIEEALKKKHRIYPHAVQGRMEASWIILDYGDVVAHVFSEEERAYYDLEELWKHARVIERVLAGRPGESPSGESAHEERPRWESAHEEGPHEESAHAESAHAESGHAESAHAESAHAEGHQEQSSPESPGA